MNVTLDAALALYELAVPERNEHGLLLHVHLVDPLDAVLHELPCPSFGDSVLLDAVLVQLNLLVLPALLL